SFGGANQTLRLRDCEASGGSLGSLNAFALSGSDIWVDRCKAVGARVFGFGFVNANSFHMKSCTSLDSVKEGFNATSSTNGTVGGNRLMWPNRNPMVGTDFGASFAAQNGAECSDIAFFGNIIDAPAKACLALAGELAGVQRIAATGNFFTSPCSIG